MALTKVTSKGQVTIPRKVRASLGIRAGDVLRFQVQGNRAVVAKVASAEDGELKALEATLEEWLSPADDAAYRDL